MNAKRDQAQGPSNRRRLIAATSSISFFAPIFLGMLYHYYQEGILLEFVSTTANVVMAIVALVALGTWKRQLDYQRRKEFADQFQELGLQLFKLLADLHGKIFETCTTEELTRNTHIRQGEIADEIANLDLAVSDDFAQFVSLLGRAKRDLGPDAHKNAVSLLKHQNCISKHCKEFSARVAQVEKLRDLPNVSDVNPQDFTPNGTLEQLVERRSLAASFQDSYPDFQKDATDTYKRFLRSVMEHM